MALVLQPAGLTRRKFASRVTVSGRRRSCLANATGEFDRKCGNSMEHHPTKNQQPQMCQMILHDDDNPDSQSQLIIMIAIWNLL